MPPAPCGETPEENRLFFEPLFALVHEMDSPVWECEALKGFAERLLQKMRETAWRYGAEGILSPPISGRLLLVFQNSSPLVQMLLLHLYTLPALEERGGVSFLDLGFIRADAASLKEHNKEEWLRMEEQIKQLCGMGIKGLFEEKGHASS